MASRRSANGWCWEGDVGGKEHGPLPWHPDTPVGISAFKAYGSYFAKVVGKGYVEGVGRHSFCMRFPTQIPKHSIALKNH